MCGIGGFLSKADNEFNLKDILNTINLYQFHRGPNKQNVYIDNKIGLCHQRLSILDLENGNQPMISDNGKIILIFNGEIYNYKSLQNKLINKGIEFKTNSDTEVILKGYELEGISFFKKLTGMFSCSILDKNLNILYLIRDRVGEKPLYYFNNAEHFIFSSELKGIKNVIKNYLNERLEINNEALHIYFQLGFIPSPHTIYNKICKLKPGSFLTFNLNHYTFSINNYWDFNNFNLNNQITHFSEAKKKLKSKFFDIIEDQMIADVPIGGFLSGGVDSSIICAVMSKISRKKINTFSIGFTDKNFDERSRSNLVAQHIQSNHHSFVLEYTNIQDDLENILLNFDEPFADSSALPNFFVSKKTKEHVTVALTGDGGDEVFGGYNRYFMPSIGNKYRSFVPNSIHNNFIKPLINTIRQKNDNRGTLFKIQKFVNSLGNSENEDIKNIISLAFQKHEVSKLLITKPSNYDFEELFEKSIDFNQLNKSRFIDFKVSLEGDMLVKVDRTSMLNSLECRAPFLNHELIEFSYNIPNEFLIYKNETKYILKKTFEDLLPQNLFNLKKSGFGVPVGDWLRNNLKSNLIEFSNKDFLNSQKIFNTSFIQKLIKEHLTQERDHTFKIWSFYCFQLWYLKSYLNEA
jgi:asparagine synthase (glutamine-hydrolysing)